MDSLTELLRSDKKRLGFFLALQALTVPIVLMIFRNITPRETAALFAGTLFVTVPTLMLIAEYFGARFRNRWLWVATLQFLLLFALPIVLVRVLNMGQEFWNLKVLGIPAPLMHEWSSKSFGLMAVVTLVYFGLSFRKKS